MTAHGCAIDAILGCEVSDLVRKQVEGNAHGPILLPSVTEREADPAQRDLRRDPGTCAELEGQTPAERPLTSSPSQEACAS